MSRSTKRSGDLALAIYAGGIFVTVVAMFVAVVISSPRPVVVVVSSDPQASPPAASAPPAGAAMPGLMEVSAPQAAAPGQLPGAAEAAPPTQPRGPGEIRIVQVAAVPATDDVFNPAWDQAPVSDIALLPQNISRPMLQDGTVGSVRVQALRDGNRIAWRLSWEAPEPSYNVDADQFTDAAAIQFSLAAGTPFLMGGPGTPVHILHWKALWQKDVDEHYQQVEDLHPNYRSDLYWFADGEFPSPYASALTSPDARQFMPAMAAGNPMADPYRQQPVEEIVAEGLGTATTIRQTPSAARGAWKDGRWTVVFDRPLDNGDPIAAAMVAGNGDGLAFAIWDGSARNVGAQKHFSNWVPVKATDSPGR